MNQKMGYKNPYLLGVDNIKTNKDDQIYYINNQIKDENNQHKRNSLLKQSKTSKNDKKLKAETPRGQSTSP